MNGLLLLVGGPADGKTVEHHWARTWWSERTPEGVHVYAPTYDNSKLEHVGLFQSDVAYIRHLATRSRPRSTAG